MTGAAEGALAACVVLILLLMYRVTVLERRLYGVERWARTIARSLSTLRRRVDDNAGVERATSEAGRDVNE